MGLYKYSYIENYLKESGLQESKINKVMSRTYIQMISTLLKIK